MLEMALQAANEMAVARYGWQLLTGLPVLQVEMLLGAK